MDAELVVAASHLREIRHGLAKAEERIEIEGARRHRAQDQPRGDLDTGEGNRRTRNATAHDALAQEQHRRVLRIDGDGVAAVGSLAVLQHECAAVLLRGWQFGRVHITAVDREPLARGVHLPRRGRHGGRDELHLVRLSGRIEPDLEVFATARAAGVGRRIIERRRAQARRCVHPGGRSAHRATGTRALRHGGHARIVCTPTPTQERGAQYATDCHGNH